MAIHAINSGRQGPLRPGERILLGVAAGVAALMILISVARAQQEDGGTVVVPAAVPVEVIRTVQPPTTQPIVVEVAKASRWDEFWQIVQPLLVVLVAFGVAVVSKKTRKLSESNDARVEDRKVEKADIQKQLKDIAVSVADVKASQTTPRDDPPLG